MKPVINPVLQAKFLQHLNKKKKGDEGFTLIELLVVVIIIGVLAAIALPSLLGQVNKAKQSEAKQNIGAMNRAQQAIFLEYQNFATSINQLQVGIKTLTDNFSYSVVGSTVVTNAYAQQRAIQQKSALKSYYGLAGTLIGDAATSEALTVSLACESLVPGTTLPTISAFTLCDSAFTSLAK